MADTDDQKTESRRPSSLKEVIKDDVVGVSDFKRTKIGSLTGFSAAARVASGLKTQVTESASRTGSLFKDLTAEENLPALPEGGAAAERFEAAMVLHRRSENDIANMVRNSCRSAWLYLGLAVAGSLASAWSMYAYPVGGALDTMARLGPLPLIYALLIKHAYTNWMLRIRRLEGLVRFIAAGPSAWPPRMSS